MLLVTSSLPITHLFQCPAHQKNMEARQDTDHLQSQRNREPDKAQTISPAAKELRARQDTNHLQRHRNLKADKTQPSLFRA